MFGSGLHFNTPDIVRVTKVFDATQPGFDFLLLDSSFNQQNVIIELPPTGPKLIPLVCVTNAINVDPGGATVLYVIYYVDNAIVTVPLITCGLGGSFSAIGFTGLNSSNIVNQAWVTGGGNAGICIAADAPFASGTSLTITLYCVRSGLNY